MKDRCRILIVEDDLPLASNLMDVFAERGYSVEVASDGRTAVAACSENGYDLALVDISLPDIDGLALVERLAEITPLTEYIIITGCPSLESAVASVGKQEILSYETKPLNLGRLISLVGQCMRRRRAEEALRKEKELAHRYLDVANVIIVAIDAGEKVTMINRRGCEILECGEEEIVGKNWIDNFLPERVKGEVRGVFSKIMRGEMGGVEYYESPVLTKSGNERIILWHNTAIKDEEVNIIGILRSGEDITERKHVEDELQLKAQLLDNATDSIFLHDLKGRFYYANESAYRSRGYDWEELMGMSLDALCSPEYAQAVLERQRELFKKGRDTYESVHICKDGSALPVEVHARIIETGDRKLILSVVREITARKRTQKKLEQSYKSLQKAVEGTTIAFELATEMRDPYTSGHQRRVTKLACAIANEMGVSSRKIEGLNRAGSIHDVGKMYVPSEILSKPGPLTEAEFSLIKVHPQAGHDILKAAEATWPIAEIVLQHHERLDGSGYPCALSGQEILLEARILAVADVVEAMSSHRPYRPAHPTDKALLEIVQRKGVSYDNDAVDACISLFTQKGYIFG